LVVLAINTWPDQDPMVVPFLTSSGYTLLRSAKPGTTWGGLPGVSRRL
jgi:hypothetical protein